MTTWTVDKRIDEARKHPGWKNFHRECGTQNFYIENIEKRGRGYVATSFRLRDRMAPPYIMYPMAEGAGRTPIDACVDAYLKAVEVGHCQPGLERLFAEEEDDLIGEVFADVADYPEDRVTTFIEDEDLIG